MLGQSVGEKLYRTYNKYLGMIIQMQNQVHNLSLRPQLNEIHLVNKCIRK